MGKNKYIQNKDLLISDGYRPEYLEIGTAKWQLLASCLADQIVVAHTDPLTGKSNVDYSQSLRFLQCLGEKIGFTPIDMVLIHIYLYRYHALVPAEARDRYQPGMKILMATWASQVVQYDEPLSKNLFQYFSRLPFTTFVSNAMDFLSTFNYALSYDAETFNQTFALLSYEAPAPAPEPVYYPLPDPTPMYDQGVSSTQPLPMYPPQPSNYEAQGVAQPAKTGLKGIFSNIFSSSSAPSTSAIQQPQPPHGGAPW